MKDAIKHTIIPWTYLCWKSDNPSSSHTWKVTPWQSTYMTLGSETLVSSLKKRISRGREDVFEGLVGSSILVCVSHLRCRSLRHVSGLMKTNGCRWLSASLACNQGLTRVLENQPSLKYCLLTMPSSKISQQPV